MTGFQQKQPVEVFLYEKGEKIYPREVKGRFQSLRLLSMIVLLGVYYCLPWVSWDERQAVLFDLPARQFHVFFMTFWPQDFFFLSILLIIAGISLFFFTAVAGRVWCGFACPQTVWTEAFVLIERWVEGSRSQQMKLAKSPWSFIKLRKKATKQILWGSFALLTGLTFVGYFQPIQKLFLDFFSFQLGGWALFWVFFYGFATYGNAGFMREQVCKYMCPYARFQSAMFDSDTLIIAYDQTRGEPRVRGKKRKQVVNNEKSGDCIDCGICVQACPTGIDIRDGLQYECIACAACIDGCDAVMERIGLPTGLIRYSTQSQDRGKETSLIQSLYRPRVLIYVCLLSMVFASFVFGLATRPALQVDVIRDRNALYRWSDENSIENVYQLKVMNKGQRAQSYSIGVSGLPEATIAWAGKNPGEKTGIVQPGEMGEFSVVVALPESAKYQRSQKITLHINEVIGSELQSVSEESRFWGPAKPN